CARWDSADFDYW
nr:immunoglobulin heavy chain junction region [Macaca mulatta]MOX67634.1 immunoglobulin heavy chain junction region [Macaca mulatta]